VTKQAETSTTQVGTEQIRRYMQEHCRGEEGKATARGIIRGLLGPDAPLEAVSKASVTLSGLSRHPGSGIKRVELPHAIARQRFAYFYEEVEQIGQELKEESPRKSDLETLLEHPLVDAFLEALAVKIAANIHIPIPTPRVETLARQKPPELPQKQRPPKIVVLGMKDDQASLLRQEYKDRIKLVSHKASLKAIPSMVKNADLVIGWKNYISHAAGEAAQSVNKDAYTLVFGGMDAIREKINHYLRLKEKELDKDSTMES